ncbi:MULTISPECIES: DNA/RNA non-specific endonuclease [Pseudomonas]|jgi:endonuclease G|uniref:DNA/RNA non-specific endonuclease n=1 Tax=Pseudomonas TaxID=286 RepID=UPI000F01747F|nr:DNA/RNA non-specific endonuclease [Pseudomonas sp. FP830]WLI44095.1 DNA/RNA non-specific endonuclease [Pseudomonas sp. FP830]
MPPQGLQVDFAHRPRLADLHPLQETARRVSGTLRKQAEPTVTPAVQLQDRQGYDSGFLGDFIVPWPSVEATLVDDIYPTGTADNRLDYQHFSIMLSRRRRLALVAGVNIDGASSVEIDRRRDAWAYDGRIPSDAQIGEALYAGNLLDRGHLVRRQDPNWGPDAQTANNDTFHFTNCSPQMAAFNQKTWLELEDYILDNTRRWKARATIFTGPLFRDDDQTYRGVQIPTAFWKVVAFLGDDGKPSASAYMIDQRQELEQLELVFGALKTYRRSVDQIEALTGIRFAGLADYDGFSNEERLTGTRIEAPIRGPEDIRL